MIARKFLLCIFGVLAAAGALAADLVVIDLRNRTAEDLLPALRPIVGGEVSLSGMDYKLLVRGSASDVAKIRDVVAILDRAPKQLIISVRYTSAPQSRSSELRASAAVDPLGTQVAVRGGVSTSTAADSNVSNVRVLEGNSAHISSGQSVPIVTAFIPTQISGRSSGVGIATDYRELSSGFDVRPRVNGDGVVLEISAQQQRLTDATHGSATVQRANTTVAGRLGEWIDLGGVSSSIEEERSGIGIGITGGGRRITTQSDQRSIAVKVELTP